MTSTLISFVSTWGLLAIFLTMALESCGLPISSEVVVPLAGALAAQDHLSFILVVIVATLANVTGSSLAYALTSRYGERIILSRPLRFLGVSYGHLLLANRFFGRFGFPAVFFGRLLPIIRTYVSFPAGLAVISWPRFLAATFLGALLWNFVLAYAGFRLGSQYGAIASFLGPFIVPCALLLALLLGLAWWFGRRLGEPSAS